VSWLPRFRVGCLIPLGVLLLCLLLTESQIGLSKAWLADWNFSQLEKQIQAGEIRLADMQDGWDLVCLATPYCTGGSVEGSPDAMKQACAEAGGDDSFAFAYFDGDELVHIETLLSSKDINISQPCLPLSSDPVIVTDGVDFKIHPGPSPD
jgi:hypothetical protein